MNKESYNLFVNTEGNVKILKICLTWSHYGILHIVLMVLLNEINIDCQK